MREFIEARWQDILFRAFQHGSLVVQSVLVALLIALFVGVLVADRPRGAAIVNALSSIGLTLPSLALLGLGIPVLGIGPAPSLFIVIFYAALPIVRSTIVGLQGVDINIVESARGQGLSPAAVLLRVRLPIAWPVIMTGIRVSTQMSTGVAAVAAYALGPGLGAYIYSGLSQIGSANALYFALVGTLGVVIVALILDEFLALISRLTTSKGLAS